MRRIADLGLGICDYRVANFLLWCSIALVIAGLPSCADDGISFTVRSGDQILVDGGDIHGCAGQYLYVSMIGSGWHITTSAMSPIEIFFRAQPSGWHAGPRTSHVMPDDSVVYEQTWFCNFADPGRYECTFSANYVSITVTAVISDYYAANPPISCEISAPTNGLAVARGQEVTCTALASDHDTKNCIDSIEDTPLAYVWSASGGSFKNGVNTGQTVTWVAPADYATCIISVAVDDPGDQDPPSYCGSKDDPPATQSVTVNVSHLICLKSTPGDSDGNYWWLLDLDIPCTCQPWYWESQCDMPTQFLLPWSGGGGYSCEWRTSVNCGIACTLWAGVQFIKEPSMRQWRVYVAQNCAGMGATYYESYTPEADWDPEVNVVGNQCTNIHFTHCPCSVEMVATISRYTVADPGPSACMTCEEPSWNPATGGVQNDTHQARISAFISPAASGQVVTFSIEGPTGVLIPAGLSLSSTSVRSQILSVPTDSTGKATAILTSSDKDNEQVVVNASFAGETTPITIAQKTCSHTTFECDPADLLADGVMTTNIRFCLVKNGTTTPIAGHNIEFKIDSITNAEGNPVAGPPFPPEYGTIIQNQAVTGTDGFATGVFRVGTEPGTIYFKAEDTNDQLP